MRYNDWPMPICVWDGPIRVGRTARYDTLHHFEPLLSTIEAKGYGAEELGLAGLHDVDELLNGLTITVSLARIEIDARDAADLGYSPPSAAPAAADLAAPFLPANAQRASPHKKGRPPAEDTILAKADEMHASGMNGREIAKLMRLETGFENVGNNLVRDLIEGRYPRVGRAGSKKERAE
ncbi:hypothetical protein GRI40_06415 [Altererythrobacter aerius]|uniref:Uncharacterized protein n=1 Tax=Tsuneonella aeria TaxID=1837929 RepID=A0A6I4TCR6_9SPHN|nr:hypothetical protein [Tsuneonella aeria]MXO74853.1 hypothetical protein [Tsuneonella aeria]